MVRIITLLVCLHVAVLAVSLDAIELKHEWSIKKIEKTENILKQKHKEFKLGIVALSDLTYWNQKLFKARKEKLDIEYEWKAEENPKDMSNVKFEDSINYVSALLNISIEQVNFFEKLLPFMKSAIEVGTMTKLDLEEFELNAIEAYAQYDYTLKLYKDHTKTKIPYELPINIVKALKKL
jgi:hypothetical protein